MKKLFIEGLEKLTTIWNNQLSVESSKNLESIEIVSCESLKSICPASVARGLQQLRRLKVRNSGVEEIISNKDGLLATTPMFVFSKLTYLRFDNLPQLKSFYPGLHASSWPSLNVLAVHRCDKVQIFAQGKHELYNKCSPNKQSLFLLEKVTLLLHNSSLCFLFFLDGVFICFLCYMSMIKFLNISPTRNTL